MTKTKQQLRAEAVERLRWFESSDEGDGYYWDVTRALLGKRPTEYDDSDELVSALIDLLTDDCDTECYECARLAELMAENSALRVIVGDLNAPADSGEASMMSVAAFVEKQTEHESEERRMAPHDCGHIADMSAKSADCVRNDGFMSEVGVRADDVDANDANADSREKLDDRWYAHGGVMQLTSENVEKLRGIVMPHHMLGKQFDQVIIDEADTIRNGFQDDGLLVADEVDTREKLEAEAFNLFNEWSTLSDDAAAFLTGCVVGFLDRQAAITERHILTQPDERDEQIAELQAMVDELTEQLESAHAKNRSLKAHIAKMQEGRHGWHVKGAELQREVDRLTRENMSLARDLGECVAERDALRRENAKLSDDELHWRNQASQVDAIREARLDKLLSQRDELQAAYDAMVGKCAELCVLAGFSMVDASGEVVS